MSPRRTRAATPRPPRTDAGLSWRGALRLAGAGGRADRARTGLTAAAAAAGTLAVLAAATVVAIDTGDGPYTSESLNEPGLRQGVVATSLFLCLPLLVFAGQCARVGAAARDRRLAALRMTGATPRDVRRIAASETAVAAAAGVALAFAVFAAARVVLDETVITTYALERRITYDNGSTGFVTDTFTGPARRLPTDVWPNWWAIPIAVLLVPLFSALLTLLALRRVSITPFGVTRRERPRPSRRLPVVLFAVGLGGTLLLTTALELTGVDVHESVRVALAIGALFIVLLVLVLAGLLLGTTALSAALGGWLLRSGRPSRLLAGRRLLAASEHSSRANSALLVLVLIAAFLQGARSRYSVDGGPGSNISANTHESILSLLTLAAGVGAAVAVAGLLVGTVENIVSRRQVIAGMGAVGVPLPVVRRAVFLENVLPLVPTILLATSAGILAARGVMTTHVRLANFDAVTQTVSSVTVVPVPVPWLPLALIALGAVAAVAGATAASLPLLRASVDPAELRAG
ncbi:FtsX-like permease family protein [Kineococcus sp. SYSU DK002]|uniref:FtsX-like permease family protein n=1 Tax=Kineococcus sp. SYSU DK002 TaxID=3383123 RepID=UPI003D7D27A0